MNRVALPKESATCHLRAGEVQPALNFAANEMAAEDPLDATLLAAGYPHAR
jgi:hypothetical protein